MVIRITDFVVARILEFIASINTSINNAYAVLTEDIFNAGAGGVFGGVHTVVNGIAAGIRGTALTILGLCFIIEFLKVLVNEDIMKWQTGFKVLAKFSLSRLALDISAMVMTAIYATAVNLIGTLNLVGNDSMMDEVQNDVEAALSGMNMFETLGMLPLIGIAFVVIWIAGIVIHVIAFARAIELFLHIAIAPLPSSLMMLEGGGSRLYKKFIMSFAACCLQGFFIVLSIVIYQSIIQGAFDAATASGTGEPLTVIAGALLMGTLVLVLSVQKSGAVAKQILDV